MATVGFIGLGTMGRDMALNLLKAGHKLRGYDVKASTVDELAALGIEPTRSIKEVATGADVVITMLPDTPDVEAVVFGEPGLLANPPAGGLIIDMSTIAPEAVRRVHAEFAKSGVEFLDAPVSGGPLGAKNATLSIMVGGSKEAFERARPIFEGMGKTITHVGATGAGQTVKLCNQLVCGLNIQAVCEAIALARASGVDLLQLRDVLMGGSAASWMLDKLGPAIIEGDAKAGFRIDLMQKDLRLVQQQTLALGVPLPGTALVTSLYVGARAHAEGANGNQALFRVYDRLANQSAQ